MAKRKREDEIAELAARVRMIITPLSRQLRQHANDGLTPTFLSAIGTIWRHGPITLGDLATHERVSPPMVTKVVGGLEEQGLVERRIDPTDRRVSWVALTPKGETWLEEARARRDAWLAERLSSLTADELATLAAALPVFDRLTQPDG
ncbi:MAG: MarR family winged helix-turn-helix transcriptional regulator [Acidimicrobiales bacterium]